VLEPAARLLEEAAGLTDNPSLATSALARPGVSIRRLLRVGQGLMDLESPLEVTIGPYETYEDELLGSRRSFDRSFTITDPKASADLSKYKRMLPEMEANLPIPEHVKRPAAPRARSASSISSTARATRAKASRPLPSLAE